MSLFNFLLRSGVSDDAIRLKCFWDIAVSRYVPLGDSELRETVSKEFPGNLSSISHHEVSFEFPQASQFQFTIPIGGYGAPNLRLSAYGFGKYQGYQLFLFGDAASSSAASDPILKVTRAAKILAAEMQRKYGFEDTTEFNERMRRGRG